MDQSAYIQWLIGRSNAKTNLAVQHPNQLSASTAQRTLQPIQHQTVHNLQGKTYLPQPTGYIAPVNHERIQTHSAPHQQDPQTTNPDIPSRYLLPVKTPVLGT